MSSIKPAAGVLALIAVLATSGLPAGAASRVLTREVGGDSLLLEVTTDKPLLAREATLPGDFTSVMIDGLPATVEIGRPALPYRTILVGIPEGKDVRIRAAAETLDLGAHRLAPVLQRSEWAPGDRTAEPVTEQEIEQVRLPAPAPGALYPPQAAEVVGRGMIRDQAFAEIRVYPVRYTGLPEDGQDSTGERLLFHPTVRVTVEFVDDTAARVPPKPIDPVTGPFEIVLRNGLVNYPMVARDRQMRRQAREEPVPYEPSSSGWNAAAPPALAGAMGAVKIEVIDNGLHEITPADLSAAGINVAMVDPQSFHLSAGGASLPILVDGEGDASFDAGDRVIFYGEGIKGDRFTLKNVYWLAFGGMAGPRMTSRNGTFTTVTPDVAPVSFVTTAHAEMNKRYTTVVRSGVNEAWFWELQQRGSSLSYDIDTPRLDPANHSIAVRARFLGLTTASHDTQLTLNSTILGQDSGFGQFLLINEQAGSSSDLVSGTNTIDLAVLLSSSAQSFIASDYFEVDYRRTYAVDGGHLVFDGEGSGTFHISLSNLPTSDIVLADVTSPAAPVAISVPGGQITGAGPFLATFEDVLPSDRAYAVATRTTLLQPVSVVEEIASNLADPSNGADYIIITHRSMLADLAPLEAYRAGEGLRTMLVATDDIYDEFNHGVFSPNAIKDFLDYAYHNYVAPAPTYVVLAGDGHIDYHDNFGSGTAQYVPATLLPFPPFGEAPSDNAYVSVAGGDAFPEMFIGRLPIRTPADAATVVSNIMNYEIAPPVTTLNQQSLFVADNGAQIFSAILENLHPKLPPGMSAATAYLPGDDMNPPSGAEIAATTTAILDGFDDGSLLAIYLGHGNVDIWASEKILEHNPNPVSGGPRLDLDLLADSGNQSLLVALNCINGYFVDLAGAGPGHVDYSLAEEFLRRPDRGAVASWAPTALGQLSDYDSILFELFENIFTNGTTEIGPALVSSVVDAVNVFGINTANIEQMTLFGDPATNLAIPACPGPVPEATGLIVTESGGDVVLDWDASPLPCATYRILAAENAGFPKSSVVPFVEIGTSSSSSFTHAGALSDGKDYDYLIVVVHPQLGDGPLGAYGQ